MSHSPIDQSQDAAQRAIEIANQAAQTARENANQAAQTARENANQAREVSRNTANRAAEETIRRATNVAERVNQAREVSRNTSNRVAEEVIRRVQRPQELPRPVSRRSRRYTQNNNILEHAPKYTLESYLFITREKLIQTLDQKNIHIRTLERNLQDIISEIQNKITQLEKQKDSAVKFSESISTSLKTGNLPTCSVCLGNIPKNNVAITNCRHLFCKNCISNSLHFSERCPVCRRTINSNEISIINLQDKQVSSEPECCNIETVDNENIDEVIEEDEKEYSPESNIPRTPPPAPRRRIPPPPPRRPTHQNSYEYNIQGTTLFSRGAGNSIRSRISRGAGNSPRENGNSPRIIRPISSRGRGNSSPRGRGNSSPRGRGENQGVSRNTNTNNNRRSPISPTRRIDYEQYRNLSQIDDRSINNSREYGNHVGIGSGWIPVPNDNPRIYRRNNQLPPINPADYGSNQQNREERVSNNRPYSTYINQPTVDQYRRNRNHSNIVPSEHGYTSRHS